MADTHDAPSAEGGPIDESTRAHFDVRAEGPTPLIEVRGEIDLSNADAFAECLSVFNAGDSIIVDLTGLTFIDSQGISVLVQTHNRGVKIVCRRSDGAVKRALDLCGLDAILGH